MLSYNQTMLPQGNPIPNQNPITPENQEASITPENQGVKGIEAQTEAEPQPKTPEISAHEKFSDQQSQAPIQNVPKESNTAPPVQALPGNLPVTEDEEADSDVPALDENWVEAVDTVIENDKDKPYEEDEDSEKLQVDYLAKRFGKRLDKE